MKQELLEVLKKMDVGTVKSDVSLANYTTYRTGGKAWACVIPKTILELKRALSIAKKYSLSYMILGNGSNVLFSDQPYRGMIIKLDSFANITWKRNTVTAGAGVSLIKLSLLAAKKGLSGLEFASGIPGTVGGAVYMNAGAYKSDMGYIVTKVKVLTPSGTIITMVNSECDFHYRSSFFKNHKEYIILEATMRLKKGKREDIEDLMRDRKERRMLTQPLNYPNAGSVFRNPSVDLPAGKIIEDLGLKGLTKGGAQISHKHANFIINIGNAKSQDMKDLIDFIKETVKENYQIDLKVEQELIGWEKEQ